MILEHLHPTVDAFARATGWEVKPEGACRGEVCVPLQAGTGGFDLPTVADRLGMPLVHDEAAGLWALGPATLSGRALPTATAPELDLPQWDGRPFRLSSLRGRKVVLVAWAPY